MKSHLFLFTFLLVLSSGFSQNYSASLDTASVNEHELKASITISGDPELLDSLFIECFVISNSDTIRLFHGEYVVEEDDPSAFTSFQRDDSANLIITGLGTFEKMDFSTRITLFRKDETTPDIILIN